MSGTRPTWLIELSQRSREELAALPPSSQPSWYRKHVTERSNGEKAGREATQEAHLTSPSS